MCTHMHYENMDYVSLHTYIYKYNEFQFMWCSLRLTSVIQVKDLRKQVRYLYNRERETSTV